ncbi:MAG TPA: methylmalonyl Co-A mutase-associated GTPase MeaB [Anaerolineae bacterium]
MNELIERARQGQQRAIARLITQVENSEAAAEMAVTQLYPYTGRAHVVGVTGPPGSGKSTLVNEVAKTLRQCDRRVGIIAVDPSSPFTGGALLGDRVRMRDLSGDPGIFIRSMASRGSLGGLSRMTAAVIKILDAAGYETILVETVGAGQAEVDIANAAHTTLVIEAPGMGDDIQSIKAGILEVADILVVNKADRPGAARAVRSLKTMLHLGPVGGTRHHGRLTAGDSPLASSGEASWQIPVLETVATDGTGVEELVNVIEAHKAYLQTTDEWLKREKERSRRELEQLLRAHFMARFQAAVPQADREQLITAVATRAVDPYAAVNELVEQMSDGER